MGLTEIFLFWYLITIVGNPDNITTISWVVGLIIFDAAFLVWYNSKR